MRLVEARIENYGASATPGWGRSREDRPGRSERGGKSANLQALQRTNAPSGPAGLIPCIDDRDESRIELVNDTRDLTNLTVSAQLGSCQPIDDLGPSLSRPSHVSHASLRGV